MKWFMMIVIIIVMIVVLGQCVKDDCDEDLADYNMNGKTGDAEDYDIMRTAEKMCRDGY